MVDERNVARSKKGLRELWGSGGLVHKKKVLMYVRVLHPSFRYVRLVHNYKYPGTHQKYGWMMMVD